MGLGDYREIGPTGWAATIDESRARKADLSLLFKAQRGALTSGYGTKPQAPFLCSMSTRLRGGPGDGVEREVDDLGAVQLFAFVDAGAELGVGQMVAQQCRGLAQEVGVGAVGWCAAAG